ncbi:MAG: hypothetical protein EZS28_021801, partial [Streblomastix strix]
METTHLSKVKTKSANASAVANKNQSEDEQRRQPGKITTSTKHENERKNNSLSGDVETSKWSGINIKSIFPTVQKRRQRKEIVRETENLFVLGLRRRGNSIFKEIGGSTKRKHNRRDTSRAGQMVQSNIYNSEDSREMEENSGCQFTKLGETNDSFQDEWNRSGEKFNQDGIQGNKSRSKVSLSPSNNISPHRPCLAFNAMGKIYQYRAMLFGKQHPPIFFAQGLAMVLSKIRKVSDIRILNNADDLLSYNRTEKIVRIITDKNENSGNIWMFNSLREVRNRTKTRDQLPMLVLGREKDVFIDDRPKKTRIAVRVREASLYLKLMDSAKTRALKNKEWKENMILPKEILQELYLQQDQVLENQNMTLEIRIPEVVTIQDASPKGWGVTLELQTGDILVQLGKWNKYQRHWTIIKKNIKTSFQGVSNKITDVLSRQSTHGDYSVNKEIFRVLCQVWQITRTPYLFTTEENKLLERFVAINEQKEESERLIAFSRLWKKQIFWIHIPIQKIGKVLIACEKFKPKSFLMEPWWPDQSSLIPKPWKEMMKKRDMIPRGKIAGDPANDNRRTKVQDLEEVFANNVSVYQLDEEKELHNRRHHERKDTIHAHGIHDMVNQNKKNKAFISKAPNIIIQYQTQYFFIYYELCKSPQLRRDQLHTQFLIFRLIIREIGVLGSSIKQRQKKLISLQISLYIVRMEEMTNINLSVSILDDEQQTAAVCILPKYMRMRKICNVWETYDPCVCSTETIFVSLSRLREHFQQSPTDSIHLIDDPSTPISRIINLKIRN